MGEEFLAVVFPFGEGDHADVCGGPDGEFGVAVFADDVGVDAFNGYSCFGGDEPA